MLCKRMWNSSRLENFTDIGQNSFGVIRLLAAAGVVLSHAWIVTGGSSAHQPLHDITGFPLGWHSVNIFFALSGLMIAASLSRSSSLIQFIWCRLLRIYPALIAVTILTIIAGGLVLTQANTAVYWSIDNIGNYFIRNMTLLAGGAGLVGVFENTPNPHFVNVSLWTLKYEVACYISAALLVTTTGALQKRLPFWFTPRYVALGILVAAALFLASAPVYKDHGYLEHTARFIFAFYTGVTAWYWRDRLIISFPILSILIAVNGALIFFKDIECAPLQILAVAYGSFFIGKMNFGWITRFADRQDYSYGLYITAYPIQQTISSSGNMTDPWLNFALSMPLSILLAAILWNMIEKPALRLKHKSIAIPQRSLGVLVVSRDP